MNQTHPIQTSNPISLICGFCIIFKSLCSSTFSTMTRKYSGRYGVQILAEARHYLFSQTSRQAPVPTQPPTQWKPELFSGSKVTSADSLTTNIHLEPSLKISGAIPPLNLLSHITYPLYAHCMTHLFYLHWSNYINIMNSFNNETHYIVFYVLLLLTPSIDQISFW